MHPKNQSLYRGLGVSANRPYIMSPNFPTRKIFTIFDWIHIMKNLCFALMDHAVYFKSVGMFVSKRDYMDLLEKTGSEISPGYRFELHIQKCHVKVHVLKAQCRFRISAAFISRDFFGTVGA